ncbi:AraC family transcriptional regulator [Undibacterium terreum]|uniref:AraC family transcriptional regulator n=1 Tax=Undibacterium terreum TaxID=1224302 RepID=A0A916UM72_9BURK|nr:AraC family transcriptional regulator [Undibacterium terreum]GGC77162.1 AraC family transcriptional regulator [Undibacterium terreum]
MSAAAAENYLARFRKVFDYIDAHLDGDLSVESLSAVAAFSKYHFHRQFSELFGVGVARYVQLCRLKRASYQLAFRDHQQIMDIALDSGYEGPEAFARAFKKSVGQTPSDFRKQPQWAPWYATYQSLSELRAEHMKTTYRADQVSITDVQETRVAVLEHHGDPLQLGDSIRQFIAWRKQNGLPPRISATFNILYNNPEEVAPEDYRLDLCAATDADIAANPYGIFAKTIPAGRCAVFRHTGSDDHLGSILSYLYSEWLPQSGEELRDFPLYLQRVRFFPDVPEQEAVLDIFIPLK